MCAHCGTPSTKTTLEYWLLVQQGVMNRLWASFSWSLNAAHADAGGMSQASLHCRPGWPTTSVRPGTN